MAQFVGRSMPVLWIRSQQKNAREWFVSGLTDNYLRVHASSSRDLWNQLTDAHLTSIAEEGGMQAEGIP
jgi:hypothetical protein